MGVPAEHYDDIIASWRREIVEQYNGNLNTGIFGTQFFFETLAANDMNDVAYEAMNKRDYPSFGHWIEQGATVTWEQWDGKNSRNHPMFGGALTWFYRKLAGMSADEENPGYKHIIIRPVASDSLTYANYSTRTPYGEASVSWQRNDYGFHLQTTIPVGSRATIYIPCTSISVMTESSILVHAGEVAGATDKGWEAGFRKLEVVTGNYSFSAAAPRK
jgi:alpha-L-rhamnosidase